MFTGSLLLKCSKCFISTEYITKKDKQTTRVIKLTIFNLKFRKRIAASLLWARNPVSFSLFLFKVRVEILEKQCFGGTVVDAECSDFYYPFLSIRLRQGEKVGRKRKELQMKGYV